MGVEGLKMLGPRPGVSQDGTLPSDNWLFSLPCLLQPSRGKAFHSTLGPNTLKAINRKLTITEPCRTAASDQESLGAQVPQHKSHMKHSPFGSLVQPEASGKQPSKNSSVMKPQKAIMFTFCCVLILVILVS